jgi:hypothetical protein
MKRIIATTNIGIIIAQKVFFSIRHHIRCPSIPLNDPFYNTDMCIEPVRDTMGDRYRIEVCLCKKPAKRTREAVEAIMSVASVALAAVLEVSQREE